MSVYVQSSTNGTNSSTLKIAVIGGGLVGALAALHLGKKGHDVHLYEYREDIRTAELSVGRSINLALSARGRKALAEVGLEEKLLEHGIPMKGRMLHDLNGNCKIVPYDRNTKQVIYSVGRKYLNEVLLTAAERYPNIHLYFNKKLSSGKLENGEVVLTNTLTNEEEKVTVDLVVGSDGAFSAVRKQMLQRPGFNFSQTYIEHGYLELCIPPSNDGKFKMPHNYLHIWPRGKFMMIALPNQDKTWTVTLFMPFENFKSIKYPEELLKFFKQYFPDAIPLIGEERLKKDYFKIRAQHLVAIKCRPYHIGSKALLLGDAAHAVVPFYGQGMNAGFEDCSILTELFNKHGNNLELILEDFSETRYEDAHAISDLAMYNYIEMRDLVNKRSYIFRKYLDDFLSLLLPKKWVPLYNSVTFTHMPYKKCIENRAWQDKKLSQFMIVGGISAFAGAAFATYHFSDKIISFYENSLGAICKKFNV